MGIVLAALAVAPWAKSMPPELRVAGLAYIVFLLVAGQPFNVYWGAIVAPILACWFAFVVEGIKAASAGHVTQHSSMRQSEDLHGSS